MNMSAQNTAQSPQEPAQTYQTSAEALGATLAEARNQLGLEQREVATRLGLNPVLIRRLEEGAFQDLGAPVYARGYLTRYVRLLELPEKEMLDRHKQLGVNEAPPLQVTRTFKPQARMSDRGIRWFSYLLLFAVIGWVGWQGYEQVAEHLEVVDESSVLKPFVNTDDNTVSTLQPEQTPANSSQSVQTPGPDNSGSAAGNVVQEITPPPTQTTSSDNPTVSESVTDTAAAAEPVTTASQAPEIASTVASSPPSETLSDTAAPATTTPSSPTESTPTSPLATTTESTPTSTVPAGPPQLSIEFTEDCWVEVKDANGERLAYGIMKADTVSTVSGPAPFSITFGNAVGVSAVKLNGNPIEPSLYRPERGTVIRFVVEPPQT